MKKQVTIVAALLILVALSSNLDMVAEAQLGPGDCYDGCSTACVQRDCEYYLFFLNLPQSLYSPSLFTLIFSLFVSARKTSRCDRKCSIRCGPGKLIKPDSLLNRSVILYTFVLFAATPDQSVKVF